MDQLENTIDSTALLDQLSPEELQAYQQRIQQVTGFAVSSGVTMAIFQVWATQPEKTFDQLALQAKVALEPVYGLQAKAKSSAPIFAGLSSHALEEFRFVYEAYQAVCWYELLKLSGSFALLSQHFLYAHFSPRRLGLSLVAETTLAARYQRPSPGVRLGPRASLTEPSPVVPWN